jgi:hypothetical protein
LLSAWLAKNYFSLFFLFLVFFRENELPRPRPLKKTKTGSSICIFYDDFVFFLSRV